MIQFPETKYATQGDLANAANVGMTTLDALFNGYQQHDENEMRNLSLQDAAEILKQRQLETDVKRWESADALDKLGSDAYRKAKLDGYIGQMNSQIAAGKKAIGTVDSDIALENLQNTNKLSFEQRLALLNKKKDEIVRQAREQAATGQAGGNGIIGFPMRGKQNPMGPRNENNSPLQRLMPQRNGGIIPMDPEYEALQAVQADDTPLRQALIKSDQKLDSTEALQIMKMQQMLALAGMKQHEGKNPWLEFSKLDPIKRLGVAEAALQTGMNPWTFAPLSSDERASFASYQAQDKLAVSARNNSTAKEGGVDVEKIGKGEIPTRPRPSLDTSPQSGGGNDLQAAILAEIERRKKK